MLIGELSNNEQIPKYHEGMLIVKVRESQSPLAGMLAMAEGLDISSLNTPGVSVGMTIFNR
ncbi:MAG TPA: hypothetical protein VGO50_02420 [Pyrinomonadaceae bacterium]|jgi:hypothetical protein|nr:hypothetical protein [Pyrinomonadaceae bacterium]